MNTKPRFPAIALLVIVALSGLLLGGCTQVQVTPNTMGEFRMGELQVVTERSFAQTYEAAKLGLKDANLFQTGDDRKVIEAELRGRDSADTQVVIKIKELAPNRTNVKIRYGVPGNLALAQHVYQSMQKHL